MVQCWLEGCESGRPREVGEADPPQVPEGNRIGSLMELQDYKVIRFWNNQVMNDIEGVIRAIILAMEPDS